MSFIQTENLVHEYFVKNEEGKIVEKHRAIDGVDFLVEHGQFIAILGKNGSGKTTFARHINALLTPTQGEVTVNGRNTRDESFLYEIRKTVGMVFQNPDNQMIATTVEEEIGFGPENLGLPTEEIRWRVDAALQAVGMEEKRLADPNHLSGGEKQRTAIAGILAMQPNCIILDEATAMLDPRSREELIKEVLQLKREKNITVILITHDIEETVYADKIFVMEQGMVVLSGTPQELFASEDETRKKYLPQLPKVVEFAKHLRKEGISLPYDILTEEQLLAALTEIFGGNV
ncbi:MAG: energy-coupling factor transporter ATPase [Lachnospiraceae bacterium]|nr:energy-coupling factor transporter ATPase [Lachnospiraceae bacterium]